MKIYRKSVPVLDRGFENNDMYLAEIARRADSGRSVSGWLN